MFMMDTQMLHSGFSGDRSEWLTMVVDAGEKVKEDMPVWMDDYGAPAPGAYYVRVWFPFHNEQYLPSNVLKFRVPDAEMDDPLVEVQEFDEWLKSSGDRTSQGTHK